MYHSGGMAPIKTIASMVEAFKGETIIKVRGVVAASVKDGKFQSWPSCEHPDNFAEVLETCWVHEQGIPRPYEIGELVEQNVWIMVKQNMFELFLKLRKDGDWEFVVLDQNNRMTINSMRTFSQLACPLPALSTNVRITKEGDKTKISRHIGAPFPHEDVHTIATKDVTEELLSEGVIQGLGTYVDGRLHTVPKQILIEEHNYGFPFVWCPIPISTPSVTPAELLKAWKNETPDDLLEDWDPTLYDVASLFGDAPSLDNVDTISTSVDGWKVTIKVNKRTFFVTCGEDEMDTFTKNHHLVDQKIKEMEECWKMECETLDVVMGIAKSGMTSSPKVFDWPVVHATDDRAKLDTLNILGLSIKCNETVDVLDRLVHLTIGDTEKTFVRFQ